MNLSERYPDEMLPVRVIPLTQGQFAIIDPEDYELVSEYKWCAKYSNQNTFYAITTIPHPDGGYRPFNDNKTGKTYNRPRNTTLQMHRAITGYKRVDHKNGNGLDNRRFNLRSATAAQNGSNSLKTTGTSSRFKGVTWRSDRGKWQAQLVANERNHYLGTYDDEIEAARAYDRAAIEHFGEYAKTNESLGLFKGE